MYLQYSKGELHVFPVEGCPAVGPPTTQEHNNLELTHTHTRSCKHRMDKTQHHCFLQCTVLP